MVFPAATTSCGPHVTPSSVERRWRIEFGPGESAAVGRPSYEARTSPLGATVSAGMR
ncbi:Uncharacterised protein [Mycobacteroides abscessus]|nr:Uncharacterised protein [Mycobacteroides abscessus]